MFDDKVFTDEEVFLFAEKIRSLRNEGLAYGQIDEMCVAIALCRVGSKRRKPMCGTQIRQIRYRLAAILPVEFTKEELEHIISYCMDESEEASLASMEAYCGKAVIDRLSCRVPILASKIRRVKNYLED